MRVTTPTRDNSNNWGHYKITTCTTECQNCRGSSLPYGEQWRLNNSTVNVHGDGYVEIDGSDWLLLHCALVYFNRSCLWVCDSGRAGGVCYHDNSKLRASIFTKLGM